MRGERVIPMEMYIANDGRGRGRARPGSANECHKWHWVTAFYRLQTFRAWHGINDDGNAAAMERHAFARF